MTRSRRAYFIWNAEQQETVMALTCREQAVSEDYVDFIWQMNLGEEELNHFFPDICRQVINNFYVTFYVERASLPPGRETQYGYEVLPSLYTLLQNESLEASNILTLQNQPVLQLKGEGVIAGFIDTGIDYTNGCFRDLAGKSRILALWDQEDQSGETPEGIGYGTVYTQADLNRALESGDPWSVVPSRDTAGHGTRLAAIAAGSEDRSTGWIGAAPLAELAVVKLKPAKQYLKEYFMVPEEAQAYQENDIMLGVRFLHELALREKKPLVICIGLGTNMGSHAGTSPLSFYLNTIGTIAGRCIVIAAGNEANQGHHFYGTLSQEGEYQDAELRVAEGERGLMMQLWSNSPDVLSVSLISPSGEEVPRVTSGMKSLKFDFLFEKTVVYVNFQSLDPYSGDQLVVIRMSEPTPGIWRIRVYGETVVGGVYNIWLPVTGFISADTVFLDSNPDITLTEPANSEIPITAAAYRTENESIYIDSSRGYTRKGRIKPDLAAPGVAVTTYGPGNALSAMTGTSAAAAMTAGASALMLEWGIVRGRRLTIGTLEIKQLMIRGARRTGSQLYPNRIWGYGTLDLYGAFSALGRF